MTQIILTSSLLILLILPLRHLLRGKVPQGLLYGIWLLVALRLLIPVQFGHSQYSVATVTEQSQSLRQLETVLQEPVAGPSRSQLYEQIEMEFATQQQEIAPPQQIQSEVEQRITAPSVEDVLSFIWIGGMIIMGIWMVCANLVFLYKAKKQAIPLENAQAPIPVRISPGVFSPCLTGLFRPVIYLTPASARDSQQLKHILTHEVTHLRHGDHIWSFLRCLCLCIYWFNPLVWVAAILSKRDCELSCDESALKQLGDTERIPYGETLLQIITHSHSPARLLETATAMNESKKQLKERMRYIVKKPRNLIFATVSLILISAIAAGCAFSGSKPNQELHQNSPSVTSPTTEPVTDATIPSVTDPNSSVTEPSDPAETQPPLTFIYYAPQESLYGRWLIHAYVDEHSILSYDLRLNEDGSAMFRWGYYGSTLLEQLEGTWQPTENQGDYLLRLVPTGGSLHEEEIDYYEFVGTISAKYTKDGTAIKIKCDGEIDLFRNYGDAELVMYRIESDSDYYSVPTLPVPEPEPVKALATPPSGYEYEPGTIILGDQKEYGFVRPYRSLYYSMPGVFLELLTDEQLKDYYYIWDEPQSGTNLTEMLLVSFVKRYNIPREEFEKAVEKYISNHGLRTSTMLHEDSEIPNTDVIYTFDNELINYYYRFE